MPAGGLAIAAVLAGVNIVRGVIQTSKANKMDAANKLTPYQISSGIYDNLDLAESRAQQGYSPQTLAFLQDTMARGLSNSNAAILQGGGSISDINNAYDNYAQQNRQVATENEKLQFANIENLFQARLNLASEEATKWNLNELTRFNNKAAAASAMRSNGNANIAKGIEGLGSAAMSGAQIAGAKKPNVNEPTKLDNNIADIMQAKPLQRAPNPTITPFTVPEPNFSILREKFN